MMFDAVTEFENKLAEYFASPFCVATDCATHAIELCLRFKKIKETNCPTHTYISVPMTLEKLGINWQFDNNKWKDFYKFSNTNIYDASVFWTPGGYIKGSMMCLSFQFKKTLSLGRGGAILLDSKEEAEMLRRMTIDGRVRDKSWAEQLDLIHQMGYRYYMTPETAQQGLKKLSTVKKNKEWSWQDYPDISQAPVFKNNIT
jgi:dTDP-4-amino-4,6-dideoxygalactose transaminase